MADTFQEITIVSKNKYHSGKLTKEFLTNRFLMEKGAGEKFVLRVKSLPHVVSIQIGFDNPIQITENPDRAAEFIEALGTTINNAQTANA